MITLSSNQSSFADRFRNCQAIAVAKALAALNSYRDRFNCTESGNHSVRHHCYFNAPKVIQSSIQTYLRIIMLCAKCRELGEDPAALWQTAFLESHGSKAGIRIEHCETAQALQQSASNGCHLCSLA